MTLLFVTYNWPPLLGGIASYAQKVVKLFPDSQAIHPRNLEHIPQSIPLFLKHPSFVGATFFNMILCLQFAAKRYYKTVPDVTVYALELQAAYPAAVLAWSIRVPFVITVHGNDILYAQKHRLLRPLAALVLNYADSIVCVSKATKKILLDCFGERLASKAVVIYPGVDLEALKTHRRMNYDAKRLLTVGKLEYGKGFHLAIEALQHLPEYTLTIIGEGPERERLYSLAQRCGVNQRVTFCGRLTLKEIAAYYHSSRYLLVPSIYDQIGKTESFGQVIVEAKACGLPTIGSDMGGISEAIGSFGYVMPRPITPDGIAFSVLPYAENKSFHLKRKELQQFSLPTFKRKIQRTINTFK